MSRLKLTTINVKNYKIRLIIKEYLEFRKGVFLFIIGIIIKIYKLPS